MYDAYGVNMHESNWEISGPAGLLEADWMQADDAESPAALAVVVHPHPLGGGTMNNKVVTTLARTCRDLGMAVVRFNFRGVGRSAGVHDHGRGELDDLRAVIEMARHRLPGVPLHLAGFSFGSYIAAAGADQVRSLLLIAPPVENYPFARLTLAHPVAVLQGDQDELVSVQSVRDWVAEAQVDTYHELAGCSHFFHGRLPELSALTRSWLMSLPQD